MATPTGSPDRIRLEPVPYHHMMLDGRWWPRSTDPSAELAALVAAVGAAHGPVARLLLSAAGWSRRPHHIPAADRTVDLAYFSDQPPSLATVICTDGNRLTLLVTPAGR
ncbi:DUF5994 family protein [Winogradskya humida]|uniref:Uncharacterized protein n=1 Tax=Winogradskya humida TaxID=113566 RepID=A0ABQ3ZJI6_9ACTN|nr:DUF5994 family protein [Actinoplanes humidus]GIE18751.1 hypothetical protein Ahu01nite_018530 [Actinoplanes humidus]